MNSLFIKTTLVFSFYIFLSATNSIKNGIIFPTVCAAISLPENRNSSGEIKSNSTIVNYKDQNHNQKYFSFNNVKNSMDNNFATTPKIMALKNEPTKYEQGLEDYEEAMAHIETKNELKNKQSSKNELLMKTLNFLWQIVTSFSKKRSIQKFTFNSLNENSANLTQFSGKENITTALQEEGRYIKGDPLKGYYDFVINEGSYKFWAAFQLATAALIIYSTFAAIYYSQVNPLTSDYDYVDYLSRSFNGRSLDDNYSSAYDNNNSNNTSSNTSIFTGNWIGVASHSFQFILDAIDNIPQ